MNTEGSNGNLIIYESIKFLFKSTSSVMDMKFASAVHTYVILCKYLGVQNFIGSTVTLWGQKFKKN